MDAIKELNQIVLEIITSSSYGEQMIAGQKLFAYTVRKDIDGDLRDFAENIALLMIQKEGRELHLEFMNTDLQKTSHELHLAKHDPLTRLPNRGLFYERLEKIFDVSRKENRRLALIILDLDEFKPVNDTYGHDAGDLLLGQVASRIKAVVGDSGITARLGGDEFVILLPELQNDKQAQTIAQKMLFSIKKPFDLSASLVFIDSSIGICFMDETTKGPRDLLKNADLAMYEAKKAGRGRYAVYPRKEEVEK
ncbi:MAG: GGDEF domain-containing protein [Proteobacteria bacterium]|nr:GGDEF domain-containing protein [Desulfobacula sp.]MBU3952398.1 GGDEF domain-containing protein [Pseudomonadota bacterium]MBU4129986.1 GGDEF domain-containing protein [Pseudomonadota bacterium]